MLLWVIVFGNFQENKKHKLNIILNIKLYIILNIKLYVKHENLLTSEFDI